MKKVHVVFPIGLAVLAMSLMFLLTGEEQRSKAIGQEPAPMKMGSKAMMPRSAIRGQNAIAFEEEQAPALAQPLEAEDQTITYTVSTPTHGESVSVP